MNTYKKLNRIQKNSTYGALGSPDYSSSNCIEIRPYAMSKYKNCIRTVQNTFFAISAYLKNFNVMLSTPSYMFAKNPSDKDILLIKNTMICIIMKDDKIIAFKVDTKCTGMRYKKQFYIKSYATFVNFYNKLLNGESL